MASPLVPSDLLRVVLVSEPQISPDGSAVYYRRSWFDRDADEIRGAIRRVARDGADRPFTSGTNDRLLRVAPDGSAAAFVGDRDGKPRLFVLRLDGGEATALVEDAEKITGVAWSPDAKRIAYVAPARSTTRRPVRGTFASCRSRATPTACSTACASTSS